MIPVISFPCPVKQSGEFVVEHHSRHVPTDGGCENGHDNHANEGVEEADISPGDGGARPAERKGQHTRQ